MEACGIEGNYRFTCENVMRVLRENKESLLAILEAFVSDPLVNWRLLTNDIITTAKGQNKIDTNTSVKNAGGPRASLKTMNMQTD